MESGFESRDPGLAEIGQRSRDERFAVDGDLKEVTASGSDAGGEEVVFSGQPLYFGNVVGVGGDQHGGGGLSEKAENGMDQERLILLGG